MELDRLEKAFLEGTVVDFGGYEYFVDPLADGIPRVEPNSFPMAWTIEGHRGFLRGLPGRLFGGSFGMRSSALRTSFSLSV